MWWLAGAGLVIIGILAVYAAILLGRLAAQKRIIKAAVNKRNQRLIDDIRYIAQAMLEQRCDLSEGVIRISNLLQAIQIEPLVDWSKPYPQLFLLYSKVQHLAIMEQRQALPCGERRQQDAERKAAEMGLQDQVLEEARLLAKFAVDE